MGTRSEDQDNEKDATCTEDKEMGEEEALDSQEAVPSQGDKGAEEGEEARDVDVLTQVPSKKRRVSVAGPTTEVRPVY